MMSLSRNFPAQAKPSYEGFKPSQAVKVSSQAELGHLNFQSENERDFFYI